MTTLPTATAVAPALATAAEAVLLDYEGRFLRRKRLVAQSGMAFMVDLPETVSLNEGYAFVLGDGRQVRILAAPEALLRVTGDLPRLAWHIGNRHTPCQIADGHLLIRQDHVLEAMLRQLGAGVEAVEAPFRPEGGAYGFGRTMGHDHGGHDHGGHGDGHHNHAPPRTAPLMLNRSFGAQAGVAHELPSKGPFGE